MAKTVFAPGSTVTSAFLNAVNNPVFVDTPSADGEIARITNDDLSNASGQIKQEWTTFRDALRVSPGSGLSITHTGGAVTLPNGSILTIIANTVGSLTNNAVNYIFVNPGGVVTASTSYPTIGFLMAAVTTVSGAITAVQDLRPRHTVLPIAQAIRVFGGQSTNDKTCTNGEVFDQGLYTFRNFTVPAGVTITVRQYGKFYCSGNVSIQGTINIFPASTGSLAYATGVPTGLNLGGISGSGIGAGSASSPTGGRAYNYAAQPYGSGGGMGFAITTGSLLLTFGDGGDGGGGVYFEAAGTINIGTTAAGSILAKGGDAGTSTVQSGSNYGVGGNGGGSGGFILLSSISAVTVGATATLDVRGGNGSAGLIAGTFPGALGGGGGGGGVIAITAPSINTSGASLLVAGGSNGANAGTTSGAIGGGNGGGFGGAGAGGGAGRGSSESGKIYQLTLVPSGGL